jgi:hypothetical protein
VRIIVIVDVRSDAVQQCSVLRVDLHLTVVTQHSGRGSAVERGQDIVLVGDVSSGHADGVSSWLVSDSLTEENGLPTSTIPQWPLLDGHFHLSHIRPSCRSSPYDIALTSVNTIIVDGALARREPWNKVGMGLAVRI